MAALQFRITYIMEYYPIYFGGGGLDFRYSDARCARSYHSGYKMAAHGLTDHIVKIGPATNRTLCMDGPTARVIELAKVRSSCSVLRLCVRLSHLSRRCAVLEFLALLVRHHA